MGKACFLTLDSSRYQGRRGGSGAEEVVRVLSVNEGARRPKGGAPASWGDDGGMKGAASGSTSLRATALDLDPG